MVLPPFEVGLNAISTTDLPSMHLSMLSRHFRLHRLPFRPEEVYSSRWKFCLKLQPDVLFQRIPTNFKISAVVSCPSIITRALLEHPTKWATRSGLRKGTGMTSGHPFVLLWVWLVLVWGQGGNAGSLLLAVVVGASRGLGHIPLVPPSLV